MIGKDGRHLSSFQMKSWMDKIAKNRKYKHPMKGEDAPRARLTNPIIFVIRKSDPSSRKEICSLFGICERHWYSIRAKKAWTHI